MPKGIYHRPVVEKRFWEKVNKHGPVPKFKPSLGRCWIWTAALFQGRYGAFNDTSAHRFSYEIKRGPIPPGLQIDHLCRVMQCVRPSHLEAVTCRENLLRGETLAAENAAKTHCPKGHPYSGYNVKMDVKRNIRICRTCAIAKTRAWRERFSNGKKTARS